ncbi:MAG: NADH-quinone oxidoreductase subunit C [Chitinispirillaceae bacterium]|nr:NADH-quinone oxidoreductase subunit C [Chitinispirillaceae bacterium]
MNEGLKEKLEKAFPHAAITSMRDTDYVVTADKESVLSLLAYVKDAGFDHLTLISCVDWIDEGEFELVYILSPYMKDNEQISGNEKINLILKTRIARGNPAFQTVTHIFENAEPYERELHELFGVHFEGHKRLIPLFLERAYDIPPFRKDFDTRRYVKEVFDNIPAIQDIKA